MLAARRGPIRGALLAGTVALLVACAPDTAVEVGAPSAVTELPPSGPAPSGPAAAPSEAEQPAPVAGECRGPVDTEIIDAAADTRPTVSCEAPHGFETFYVGEMDAGLDEWPGDDERAGLVLGRQVNEECSGRHLDYLGFDPGSSPNLPPDRLETFAYFVPTEEDFAAGARWFRCDALVTPLAAGESTAIDGTLEGVYGQPLPVAYRRCEARLGQPAGCDREHEIEYLASVELSDLTDYPTQRGDPRVAAACRPLLLAALGLTEERSDLAFGYLLPSQDQWESGAKGATCVVGATDRSALEGTLAAIGPSAPLPVVD